MEASKEARNIADVAKVLDLSPDDKYIDIYNLMEYLLHLNNYESYDPTGVEIRRNNNCLESTKYHTFIELRWIKGGNSIGHFVRDDGETHEYWRIGETAFRKNGPCDIFLNDKGVCIHRVWDDHNHPGMGVSEERIKLKSSSPIINWKVTLRGSASYDLVEFIRAMKRMLAFSRFFSSNINYIVHYIVHYFCYKP